MAYTVIWYTKIGVLGTTPFNDESAAKSHVADKFSARRRYDGVVCAEVRKKEDGSVVYRRGGASNADRT